ncbi:MAG: PorP/SprF family type IX secretion system membrane protein, partial [Saprospiraceae bacterium]
QDWLGVGLVFINDKAGASGLTTSGAKLGATYHLALNKKGTTTISLGAQYGKMGRKLDRDKLQFQDGFNNGSYNIPSSQDYGQIATDNVNYTDIDAGVVLSSRLNKRMDFNIGFAMYHIPEPNYGLVTAGGGTNPNPNPNPTPATGNSDFARRAAFHGQLNAALTDRFTLSPTFFYQTLSGADEITVQALGGYLFDPVKEITINFGLGYRLGDAIQALAGAKYKSLTVGLAYDINTSDLNSASNYRGGFEIAANYIVKIYKNPVTKTKLLCPRF